VVISDEGRGEHGHWEHKDRRRRVEAGGVHKGLHTVHGEEEDSRRHAAESYHTAHGHRSSDGEVECVRGTGHVGCRRERDHVDHRTQEVGRGDDCRASESDGRSLGDVPLES
jgi:hypothetical protein